MAFPLISHHNACMHDMSALTTGTSHAVYYRLAQDHDVKILKTTPVAGDDLERFTLVMYIIRTIIRS